MVTSKFPSTPLGQNGFFEELALLRLQCLGFHSMLAKTPILQTTLTIWAGGKSATPKPFELFLESPVDRSMMNYPLCLERSTL